MGFDSFFFCRFYLCERECTCEQGGGRGRLFILRSPARGQSNNPEIMTWGWNWWSDAQLTEPSRPPPWLLFNSKSLHAKVAHFGVACCWPLLFLRGSGGESPPWVFQHPEATCISWLLAALLWLLLLFSFLLLWLILLPPSCKDPGDYLGSCLVSQDNLPISRYLRGYYKVIFAM